MFLGGVGTAVFWLAMSCGAVAAIYALRVAGVQLPVHPVKDMQLLYLLCELGLYVVMVVFVLLFELTKTQGFIKLEQALKIDANWPSRRTDGQPQPAPPDRADRNRRRSAPRAGRMFCLPARHRPVQARQRYLRPLGGDEVLRQFALTVQRQIRDIDSFGRYGGEEFLLMAPKPRSPNRSCWPNGCAAASNSWPSRRLRKTCA
jgi:hypothetical protein